MHHTDVWIHKTSTRTTVWVKEAYLTAVFPKMNEDYLRTHARPRFNQSLTKRMAAKMKSGELTVMPRTGAAWRWAKRAGSYWYDYDYLPDRKPTAYQKQVAETKEALLVQVAASERNETWAWVSKELRGVKGTAWEMVYGKHADGHRQSLALSAALLEAMVQLVMARPELATMGEYYLRCGQHLEGVPGASYLPRHPVRLKEKVLRVLEGEKIQEVVCLPRTGNDNAVKYPEAMRVRVAAWLAELRASGANYTNAFIARRVQWMCEQMGYYPIPRTRWIEMQMEAAGAVALHTGRWSGQRRALLHRGYIPQEGAMHAGDCWMMDATRVNMLSFPVEKTLKDGSVVRKRAHLMAVVVYDVMSGCFLHVEYCFAENHSTYMTCLAKAVQKTGYVPYEVVIDRFPGHNRPEWKDLTERLQRAGTRVTVAYEMQGKARLERAFNTAQQVGMQMSEKYYGEGIPSQHAYAHRTEDWMKAIQKQADAEGWNVDKAMAEASAALKRYNETPIASYQRVVSKKEGGAPYTPQLLHDDCTKPHALRYDRFEALQWFGRSTVATVRHEGMVLIKVLGVKYFFVLDPDRDFEAILNTHQRQVRVYYDLEDMGSVELYTVDTPANERHICTAMRQGLVKRYGPAAQTAENKAAVGAAKARIEKVRQKKAQRRAEILAPLQAGDEVLLYPHLYDKAVREGAERAMMEDVALSLPLTQTAEAASDEGWSDEDFLDFARSNY